MKTKEITKFRKTYTKYEKNCVFEGYKLAVLFDEKDDVKRYGGRWDADLQTWWMPKSKLLNEIHDNGYLVRQWLNDHQMIMGQYGAFQGSDKPLDNNSASEYKLKHGSSENRVIILWWDAEDAVSFHQSKQNGTFGTDDPDPIWMSVENARTHWNELISEGYIRAKLS